MSSLPESLASAGPGPAPDAAFVKRKTVKARVDDHGNMTVYMAILLCFAFITAGSGFVRDMQFHDRVTALEQAFANPSVCPPCPAAVVAQVHVPGPLREAPRPAK